jgi:dTDP-L-rhamnose 4-epimerase
VYIDDVVEATTRCVESPARPPVALNVGTGRGVAVAEVVKNIVGYFESRSPVSITGAFRQGDIRHNCAEGSKLLKVLDFAPSWSFEDGIRGFLAWAETNQSEPRLYERSLDEMRAKGLLHG